MGAIYYTFEIKARHRLSCGVHMWILAIRCWGVLDGPSALCCATFDISICFFWTWISNAQTCKRLISLYMYTLQGYLVAWICVDGFDHLITPANCNFRGKNISHIKNSWLTLKYTFLIDYTIRLYNDEVLVYHTKFYAATSCYYEWIYFPFTCKSATYKCINIVKSG
jgi:hypothetical protein